MAFILVLVSGAGMLVPDPLPFLDEGVLLLILLSSLSYLGLDLRGFFGGKGGKDRVTVLPDKVISILMLHLERVKVLHHQQVVLTLSA